MSQSHRSAILMAVALALTVMRAAPLAPQDVPPPPPDVVGFCEARGTLDDPGAAFSPGDHRAGRLPEQIAAVEGASRWRCMNGKVLVCRDDASGDWCSAKDASLVPARALVKQCAAEPAMDPLPSAMTAYSSSQWRCVRGKPVAFDTLPLDGRDFFRGAWVEYAIGADGQPAPVTFPDGVR